MTLISRNVYIDKVEDIVNKYNNTYSTIIKMKRVDVKPNDVKNIYINCSEGLYDNDPKSKIGDVLQYQNTKTFLPKAVFQIGLEKFLSLQNLKTLCRPHILLVILTKNKFLERFTKKNCKKTKQKEFRVEKLI